MPLFKFGYVDPNKTYSEFFIGVSLGFEFVIDHDLDIGDLYFEAPLILFEIEGLLAEPLLIPTLDLFFEAQVEDALAAYIDASLPLYIMHFEAEIEDSVDSSFNIDIFPVFTFDVDVPLFSFANINIGSPSLLFEFDAFVPILAEIDIQASVPYLDFEAYHANLASLSISSKPSAFKFEVGFGETSSIHFKMPPVNFFFKAFPSLSESSLNISTSLVNFRLTAIHESQKTSLGYEEIIKFDYELYMFEILKSITPQYKDVVIRFEILND